jgi:hypothetical protein
VKDNDSFWILVSVHGYLALWSLGPITFSLWKDRTSWWGAYDGTKLLSSWWPGERERERKKKRKRDRDRDREKERERERERENIPPFRCIIEWLVYK